MSVLIKDDNYLKLFVKGADNVIKQRLNMNEKQPFINEVNQQLEAFSVKGFRTLVLAMRIVEEEEYEEFSRKMEECEDDKSSAGFNNFLIIFYYYVNYLNSIYIVIYNYGIL